MLRSSRHLGPHTLRPKLNNSTRSCCRLQQVCLACPVSPAAPKKRCLNGAVWGLRAQKLALRKIWQAATVSSNTRLRLFFHLWKFPATAAQTIAQHQAYEHANLRIQIRFQCQQLLVFARRLRRHLRQSKAHALQDKIAALTENACWGGFALSQAFSGPY